MCSEDQKAHHEDKISYLLTHGVILDAPGLVLFLQSSFHDSCKRLTKYSQYTTTAHSRPLLKPFLPHTERYYSPRRSVCVLPPIGVEFVLQLCWLHSSVALLMTTFTNSLNLNFQLPWYAESISNHNTARFLVVPLYST